MAYDQNHPNFSGAHDQSSPVARQSVAVVGSGVSGLSAAWALSHAHDVTLFEKDDRLGGHANTVDVLVEGRTVAVDTGFIVYNEANYPNLVALFDHLGVETAESDMSFGASLRDGASEYSGQTLSSVFATRQNAVSPRFWRMLIDVARFHRAARKALAQGIPDTQSLGDFVSQTGLSMAFVEDFIGPMAGAIWSTPNASILDYPARSFIEFYANHGLLQVLNMPVWRTVLNGSRNYVTKLIADYKGTVKTGASVDAVYTAPGGKVRVEIDDGEPADFDQVVIACHGDAAQRMVRDANADETRILSSFRYQPNHAVLHTDKRAMPTKRSAWSAWNVLERGETTSVTYWMNKLQPLDTKTDIFVTLNPPHPLYGVLGEWDYDHPLYDLSTYRAQRDIWALQGERNIWFAGAHLGAGFHEDGIQAGLAVAEAIGGFKRPWQVAHPSGRLAMEKYRGHADANQDH